MLFVDAAHCILWWAVMGKEPVVIVLFAKKGCVIMANFLVWFKGHRGRIVVDASSANEAKNTAFKHLDVPRDFIFVEEREDAWDHIVQDGVPVMRDGEGAPIFLRANAAPVDL